MSQPTDFQLEWTDQRLSSARLQDNTRYQAVSVSCDNICIWRPGFYAQHVKVPGKRS